MKKVIRDNDLEELEKYMSPESSDLAIFGRIGINKSQIGKLKEIDIRDSVGRPTSFGGVLNNSWAIEVIAVLQGTKNQDFYFGDYTKYLKSSSRALVDFEPPPQITLSMSPFTTTNRMVDAGKKGLPTIYIGYGDVSAKVGTFEMNKYKDKSLFGKSSCEIERTIYSLDGMLENRNVIKFKNRDGVWKI